MEAAIEIYKLVSLGVILIGVLSFLKLMVEKKNAKVIYAKVVDKKLMKGSMNYLNGNRSLTYQYPVVLVIDDKTNLGIYELKRAKQSTDYEIESEVPVYKIVSRFEGVVIKSVKGYYSIPVRIIVLGVVLYLLLIVI